MCPLVKKRNDPVLDGSKGEKKKRKKKKLELGNQFLLKSSSRYKGKTHEYLWTKNEMKKKNEGENPAIS